jgi:hypothetical protein
MPRTQKQNLREHYGNLYEAREYLAEKLCEESDRKVRDLLVAARFVVGLALLYLEKIEYGTDGAYSREKNQ